LQTKANGRAPRDKIAITAVVQPAKTDDMTQFLPDGARNRLF